MSTNYAIKIRHFRTGVWTINTSVTTTASKEQIQQEYEALYKQPVQVEEMSTVQVDDHFDSIRDSIVAKF